MRKNLGWLIGAVVLAGCVYAGTVQATPSSQFVGTTVALGRFSEIDVNLHTIPADIWQSRQKTKGDSDVYVQSNVWQPGGTTGWHSHPANVFVLVRSGRVAVSDGDTCTRTIYNKGDVFVETPGHVHKASNVGDEQQVVLIATFVGLPPNTPPTTDEANPC